MSAAAVRDALVTALTAVQYDGNTLTPVARKFLSLPPGKSSPGVVITVEDDGLRERLDALKVLARYRVRVALIVQGGNELADSDEVRDWRDEARDTVMADATYSGVTGFNKADGAGYTPYNTSAADATLIYSVVGADVEIIEVKP